MNRMIKYAAAAGVAGVLALGMATPSQARDGRNAAAAIGFGAGALVGVAAASAANHGYYGPGYADGPVYAERGYAYDRDYGPGYGAYAYVPAGDAAMPACAIEGTYGKPIDHANCY